MNKIAQYLNEHILGEVSTDTAVRQAFSTDASVLTLTPEMVVYPRTTNDIRKIARFAWQLAEKGHTIPLTPRGGGTDETGAAIGKGMIVSTTAYMNTIFELDSKQKLVRLQPGVNFKALNDALKLHGLHIPSYPASAAYSTVGGAIANNASGVLSGKYGATDAWVNQLEVVLSNGDVLQTGRLSKRELNRKKAAQTFEGEIYREIDNLITEHKTAIDGLSVDVRDNAGYSGIAKVKRRDGSFDLAPLFVGSQGTLGLISEIIMKADFAGRQQTVVAVAFESTDAARDALDQLAQFDPSLLEMIDSRLFEEALKRGKKYSFYTDATEGGAVGAIIVFELDDTSDRAQKKKLKRARKLLETSGAFVRSAVAESERLELLALRDVSFVGVRPDSDELSGPPILDGAYVPRDRYEEFSRSVSELGEKHHSDLTLYGHVLDGVIYARPALNLHKVSDKQKIFKLLGDYTAIVTAHGGHLIGEAAEGRLKASFAYEDLDDEVSELYKSIKNIFDPQNILNPGVKQSNDLKSLVSSLNSDYSLAAFAHNSPKN